MCVNPSIRGAKKNLAVKLYLDIGYIVHFHLTHVIAAGSLALSYER